MTELTNDTLNSTAASHMLCGLFPSVAVGCVGYSSDWEILVESKVSSKPVRHLKQKIPNAMKTGWYCILQGYYFSTTLT